MLNNGNHFSVQARGLPPFLGLTGPCGRTQKLQSATMVFCVVDIKATLYLLSGGYLVRVQPRLPIYLQLKYDQTPISPRCSLPRLRTARRLLQSPAEERGRDRLP